MSTATTMKVLYYKRGENDVFLDQANPITVMEFIYESAICVPNVYQASVGMWNFAIWHIKKNCTT